MSEEGNPYAFNSLDCIHGRIASIIMNGSSCIIFQFFRLYSLRQIIIQYLDNLDKAFNSLDCIQKVI